MKQILMQEGADMIFPIHMRNNPLMVEDASVEASSEVLQLSSISITDEMIF
jgi:hypothetical protein